MPQNMIFYFVKKSYLKLLLSLLFILLAHYLYAQNNEVSTLFEANWINNTGRYGSFETKFAQIEDETSVFVGGRGGILINHTYSFGIAGYFLMPESTNLDCLVYKHKKNRNNTLKGGYGGLLFEYIYSSSSLFHFSGSTLVGIGGIKIEHGDYRYQTIYKNHNHPTRAFFIFEPALATNLNLTSNFKATLGIGYRITSNKSLKYHDREFGTSAIFNGFSASLSILFYEIY